MIMRKTYISQRGSAIVEFALVIPLLIFLITAMMDVSRYYFLEQSMSHTVREAARKTITGKGDEGDPDLTRREAIIKTAKSENPGSIPIIANPASNQPSDTFKIIPDDGGASGEAVTISLNYNFKFCTPLLEHLIHDKGHSGIFTINVKTTYKNEQFDDY
jgi:hypothetical protein